MWNLFKRKIKIELSVEIQLWIQDCFLWQTESLPKHNIKHIQIQKPDDFFSKLDLSRDLEKNAEIILDKLLEIVQMPKTKISLKLFQYDIESINTSFGELILEQESDVYEISYCERKGNKFIINVNKSVLEDLSILTLVLMRELSAVKLDLLGVKEIIEGQFIDVFSICFGFGLFSMNESFKYNQNETGWGYSKMGELSYNELVYCISLFSYLRNERYPEWVDEINIYYRKKVIQTIQYLFNNEKNILDEKLISFRNNG